MKNYIINWGESYEMFAVISSDANLSDVENLQLELKNKLNAIDPDEEDNGLFYDKYDKIIQEVFHEKNFLCVILDITAMITL